MDIYMDIYISIKGQTGIQMRAQRARQRETLTGGEVVLKSSEPAELECEGVKGGMPMNWW